MHPRHARCVLSRLRCNEHSLLLGSYLSRIGRIEHSSCSACGHSSQDISHLILHCPTTDFLRRSLFGHSLPLYDLWSRPWGVARLPGLRKLPPYPHFRTGSGKQQHVLKRSETSKKRADKDFNGATITFGMNYKTTCTRVLKD